MIVPHLMVVSSSDKWGHLMIVPHLMIVFGCLWALRAQGGRMCVSWCIHWYCIYHANNWDMCKLLGVCGGGFLWALPALGGGIYVNWCIHYYCIYHANIV